MKKVLLTIGWIVLGFIVFLTKFSYADDAKFLKSKNLNLINESGKGEKLFYDVNSFKRLSESKIEVNLIYLPSDEITQKCENYWVNWFLTNEYREVMWTGIPEEEKERCKSLKYGVYKWKIDCKRKNFKEIDFTWYDEKEKIVYQRKTVGISFISIPSNLINEEFFEKLCKF